VSARTLDTAALAAIERAIAAALALDPRARDALVPLQGRVLKIELTTAAHRRVRGPQEGSVRLASHHEGSVDCSVSGAASDFIALALAADKPAALVNGELRVGGDSTLLLELQRIFEALDIDWEQRLAVALGDAAAHQIGRALRGGARFGARARTRLEQHIEEFIHEEARLALRAPRSRICSRTCARSHHVPTVSRRACAV
jgi:ubiquinone biosynthesis protein UbiJ